MTIERAFYAEYCLKPFERKGALLRIHFPDGAIGYSDCHPWPELGDLPLDRQLASFASPASLLARSLFFARLDADYRKAGKHLLEGKKIPKSHLLVSPDLSKEKMNAIKKEGFSHLKIKLNKNTWEKGISHLGPLADRGLKVRFDFNHSLTEELFCAFLEKTAPFHSVIDFCEDPFPYEKMRWRALQEKWGVQLAEDRLAPQHDPLGEVAIFKPAIQASPPSSKRVIVTSYLDHPVGQVCAAFMAAGSEEVAGLLSHRHYLPTSFSMQLPQEGPDFIQGEGTGVGFDSLLEEMRWKKVWG